MKYLRHDSNGRIICIGQAPEGSHFGNLGSVLLDPPDDVSPATHYILGGMYAPFPARPSAYHEWNWALKAWEPDLNAARDDKKRAVDVEFVRRTFAPIPYDNAPFDADERVSRPRITGLHQRLMRGDPLPPDWIGWRDANNDYHWPTATAAEVQAQLAGLARAIEDREQALLVAAWRHKESIKTLPNLWDVIAYPVTQGWPG